MGKMSKSLRIIAGVIIALFLVAIVGLAGLASQAPAESRSVSGGLERAVSAAEEANLTITAVSPMDAYGEDFVVAFPACQGTTPEQVSSSFGLPEAPEGMADEVPEGTNYLVLVRADGTSAADAIPQDRLDLCSAGQLPPFNAAQMLPLAQTTEGGWSVAM